VSAASGDDVTLKLLHVWEKQKYQLKRRRERKRLGGEGEAQTHRNDRNRARKLAGVAEFRRRILTSLL
jgi:hypothetical protein